MDYVEQDIVFETQAFYGQDVPLSISSVFFRRLENTIRPSIRMALEGNSTAVGAPPAWLELVSDIRTLGFLDQNGSSVLRLKAPQLGGVAPRLFEQRSLWAPPVSPDDTALQLIGRIAAAISQQESSSDLYDRPLLKAFSRIPPAMSNPRRPERRSQTPRIGVASFFGTWPGEESDHDLLKALEEVRS